MRGADANEGLPAATLDAVQEMSDLLDADLGRPALEVLTRLCDQGVNPTALAAVVRELRKERDALAAAASQAGGEPPRR